MRSSSPSVDDSPGPGRLGEDSPPLAPLFLLLALLLLAYGAQVSGFWSQLNDDAFITFRYSRNLAEGHGPYYNPGEHVEGYTNFLHMLTLAGVIRAFGPEAAPVAAKLLGVFAGAGCVLVAAALAWLLLRSRHRRWAPWGALAAGGLVAASPGFAVNTTTGLETAPYALFLGLGCLAALVPSRRSWLLSSLAFGAAALSRPEGLMIFTAHWLASAPLLPGRRSDRREWLLSGAVVFGIAASHLGFRLLAYDGEWLPNTYFAKRGGYWGDPLSYIRYGILRPIGGPIGAILAALGWITARGRPGVRALPLAAGALLGGVSPLLAGTDWMVGYRLVVPYLPLLAPVAVTGWVLLAGRIPRLAPGRTAWGLLAIPVVLSITQITPRTIMVDHVATRTRGYVHGHQELARWCRSQLEPGDTIALMDIGMVGYLCPRNRILDLTGLTDRAIAKSEGTFLKKRYDPNYVLDQHPEVIVLVLGLPRDSGRIPPPETRFYFVNKIELRIADSPGFLEGYRREPRATPWSRWPECIGDRAGAVMVFEHDHPRFHYLLAAFRRGA